ncbi:Kinesin- protein 12 [Nowakowskiella sp. JEL0407]|nr:Kinesin- protein 12 [Nowakowskiella sp. JEL0407]
MSELSSTNTPKSGRRKENIKVIVRLRPPSHSEQIKANSICAQCVSDVSLNVYQNGLQPTKWTFDKVYDLNTSQESIFEYCGIKDLVIRAIEGYATTIFTYGQTGSGKTFTITGPENEPMTTNKLGLVPRSLKFLFDCIGNRIKLSTISTEKLKTGTIYTVRAVYMEIYNENVLDLLSSQNSSLSIRWTAEKGFYVENLLVLECENLDDCLVVLEEGLKNRTTRSHNLNDYSSRSHSILTIYIDGEYVDEYGCKTATHGKISFVDLAGSEKLKTSRASGQTLKETLNINKSLLTLGNCISALSDKKSRRSHIPYRDSKLTQLLSDSLGGNGLALMIACISPSSENIQETLKTLRYATRASRIKNQAVPYVGGSTQYDEREELVRRLRRDLLIARKENEELRAVVANKELAGGEILRQNRAFFGAPLSFDQQSLYSESTSVKLPSITKYRTSTLDSAGQKSDISKNSSNKPNKKSENGYMSLYLSRQKFKEKKNNSTSITESKYDILPPIDDRSKHNGLNQVYNKEINRINQLTLQSTYPSSTNDSRPSTMRSASSRGSKIPIPKHGSRMQNLQRLHNHRIHSRSNSTCSTCSSCSSNCSVLIRLKKEAKKLNENQFPKIKPNSNIATQPLQQKIIPSKKNNRLKVSKMNDIPELVDTPTTTRTNPVKTLPPIKKRGPLSFNANAVTDIIKVKKTVLKEIDYLDQQLKSMEK